MRIVVPALILSLLLATSAQAEKERMFIDEAEPPVPTGIEEPEPWKEADTALPPWPRDEDLVEFRLDSPSPFRYYIDARSLPVGPDEVVR